MMEEAKSVRRRQDRQPDEDQQSRPIVVHNHPEEANRCSGQADAMKKTGMSPQRSDKAMKNRVGQSGVHDHAFQDDLDRELREPGADTAGTGGAGAAPDTPREENSNT
ncbi:hypothetical protein [Novosphingobium sp. UBA1939]|uniref:hypothetical protein n=1 Tax=Novosphingobium sp. UBA1939 TaxID=1946982 RepID=UPI0025D81127|nr:hypothetical protein [Novosphingobium sp. UBA1939]